MERTAQVEDSGFAWVPLEWAPAPDLGTQLDRGGLLLVLLVVALVWFGVQVARTGRPAGGRTA